MDVIEVTKFGGPEVLEPRQAAAPVAGPGQVVVGLSVVDVLSLESQLRSGWGRELFGWQPPVVPGTGGAGHVLSVGDGVDPAWVGRRVAGQFTGGSYAEQALSSPDVLVEVPSAVSLRQAAALIQVGPAALRLLAGAELAPGARVLVTGAGGALGLPVIQLARAAGAHVTAAAHGPTKRAAAIRAGAAVAVDYDQLSGQFDVVFDGVGGTVGGAAFELVVRGGTFLAYGVPSGAPAPVTEADARRRGVRLVGMAQVQFTPEEYRRFAEQTMTEAAAGRLTTVVGLAVPLERAAQAHAALESRELVGKAVLVVTAQAAGYTEYGDADVLTVKEIPLPKPGVGQVRVAVRAAGVNGIDWKLRQGMTGAPLDGPATTGIELAGTVDALGPGVTRWRVGDPVYGTVTTGAAATHALADADALAAKPAELSYDDAAALPVAVQTAYRTLTELGVTAGHTLLIHAVAGGVGLAAAQLALARGAHVIGTASERHHDRLRAMGIDPVTYGDGLADRLTRPVDRVLDASGRGVIALSVTLTGDPDKVVTIADPVGAAEHGVRFSRGGVAVPPAEVAHVRVPVAEVFPLTRVADAHRRSEDGHFFGKIVITTTID